MQRKLILSFLIFIGFIGSAYFITYNRVKKEAMKLPDNSPSICSTPNNALPRVVLVGDSITHGKVSANYVSILENNFQNQYQFINAGINSNLAYNVLQRLDEIIQCKPTFITILIGTNDVNSTLNTKNQSRYISDMNLPRTPDLNWYEENLRKIIERLQKETSAKIAVLSLPVIGEDLNSTANQRVKTYSAVVKILANEYNIKYLPLNEKQNEFLAKQDNISQSCESNSDNLMITAIASHFLFKKSWDEISETNKFKLVTDCLHFNHLGASFISDLIADFLKKSPSK
ncbi:MAG TPA: GDSL-type esterase/lipase family protein [Leptospiraceae bacterium]|nr:GDSL-type esterase/lipase family protein [Leptospiraceae bacterium]HMW04096.1 GDSL-type esterase/lipase family protein [Leptospiraceae bacterium]HMX30837.1 GDSL-type esterase/lipase family protein [Leptospiraceae bacterium]HMY30089.1 GDSL-type esterase/lipase family protein [Leptospiraceae bacterium]HMZ62724.1 GDSL-type esterase/lipase family protein [Leptospiraceae bacterium]